jgi:GH43 family beta-xylosidase
MPGWIAANFACKTLKVRESPKIMVRGQKKFVAYYRVSTDKQGVRGLGMEAQARSVGAFVQAHDGRFLASFHEVESGKRSDALNSTPRLLGLRP